MFRANEYTDTFQKETSRWYRTEIYLRTQNSRNILREFRVMYELCINYEF